MSKKLRTFIRPDGTILVAKGSIIRVVVGHTGTNSERPTLTHGKPATYKGVFNA